jgi:sec-independent protein translocase protein TatC
MKKKTVFPLLILVPFLFFLGAIFVYYIIFPLAWKFFLSFEQVAPLPLKLEAKVSEYLEITIAMVIAFGVAFELPVMLVFLAKLGLITSHDLIKKRRFAIVIIFIVAAILTPPDVISQIGLAIAMLILYELSIIACKKIK